MKRIILLTAITFSLFSCSSFSDKKTKEEQQRDVEKRSRLEILNYLSSHYGAVFGFDTLDFRMTYQYQDFLNKNSRIILAKFQINDIVKQDSTYIVSIEIDYNPAIFIDLTCTKTQMQELLGDATERDRRRSVYNEYDNFIIATITSIHKIKYKIKPVAEQNDEEEPTVYLELDTSDAFLCKGKIIDVYKRPKGEQNSTK